MIMTKQNLDFQDQRCQIQCVPKISEAIAGDEELGLPFHKRIRLTLKRWLSPQIKRFIKNKINNLIVWVTTITGKMDKPTVSIDQSVTLGLKSGDLVRVRSKEEIQATLNFWNELKGCGFMVDMESYCGTIQRVLKPVERFIDERDYREKRARGVVLLEGIMCQGCDRACYYFWREEWLDKIN
jgi:hypothetical protein